MLKQPRLCKFTYRIRPTCVISILFAYVILGQKNSPNFCVCIFYVLCPRLSRVQNATSEGRCNDDRISLSKKNLKKKKKKKGGVR